jgi:hypothetical protein
MVGTRSANGRDSEGEIVTRRRVVGRLGAGAGVALLGGAIGRGEAAAKQATPTGDGGQGDYLVIRRYRLKPGASFDELVRRVESGFVPLIEAVPGFVEYMLVDVGEGDLLTVSVFADQAGAEASTAAAADWAPNNVAELSELPAYEVIAGAIPIRAVAGEHRM